MLTFLKRLVLGSGSPRRSARSTRPRLEVLEGRLVPAYGGNEAVVADFNGDGFGDMAVPDYVLKRVGPVDIQVARVRVIFGAPRSQTGSQLLLEEAGSRATLAAGDFAGAVHVFHGAPGGFERRQLWHQDVLDGERAEHDDAFGHALAVGDFNGDGRVDLAVGAPGEWRTTKAGPGPIDVFNKSNPRAGVVHIIYSGRGGLQRANNHLLHQDVWGVSENIDNHDRFGDVLAAGDFNGDGFADLAIGVPGEDFDASFGFPTYTPGVMDAGAVSVHFGQASGLLFSRSAFLHQPQRYYGIPSYIGEDPMADDYDRFGSGLAVGDFNGDGLDDLVVGIPGEEVAGVAARGAIQVFFGTAVPNLREGRLLANALTDQSTVPPVDPSSGAFGESLAVGDFNGDGLDDLAVGIPHARVGGVEHAGIVQVLYGTPAGPGSGPIELWHQGIGAVRGEPDTHDFFGHLIAAGDLNRDGVDDLLAFVWDGPPMQGFPPSGLPDRSVNVFFGSRTGLTDAGNELWSRFPGGYLREDPLRFVPPWAIWPGSGERAYEDWAPAPKHVTRTSLPAPGSGPVRAV